MACGRWLLRPVRLPIPPHPHEEPQAVRQAGGSSSQAAGRVGGCRSSRSCSRRSRSRRARRRAESRITVAGRDAVAGGVMTRTRCRCISASFLCEGAAHATPRFRRRRGRGPGSTATEVRHDRGRATRSGGLRSRSVRDARRVEQASPSISHLREIDAAGARHHPSGLVRTRCLARRNNCERCFPCLSPYPSTLDQRRLCAGA
jgi:hypothetical protein